MNDKFYKVGDIVTLDGIKFVVIKVYGDDIFCDTHKTREITLLRLNEQ